MKRSYQSNQLPEINEIISEVEMSDYIHGDFILRGQDPIIRSPHRLGYASAVAQGANSLLAGMIWHARTGHHLTASMPIESALNYLHYSHYTKQNGFPMQVGAETVSVNSYFKCKDGRAIHTIAGPPYMKLLNGYLDFFDCGNSRKRIAEEVAKWNSFELEEALAKAGLPACVARSKQEWLMHPVGKALNKRPLISIEHIHEGEAVPYSPQPQEILDGIKVIDFTHVLAGPMLGQNLGRFGAETLHISSPKHPDTLAQNLITGFCKRNAYLDLHDHEHLTKMKELMAEADVFINSYRPGIPDRFGLDAAQVASMSPKGIIYVDISCYGHETLWSDRPGFETIGQACSGFSVAEGTFDDPKFSPVFYLNDPLTSFHALSGVLAALHKRALFGGSYHVKVSLAKTGMWVTDLGLLEDDKYKDCPKEDIHQPETKEIETVYGKITRLAPCYQFNELRLPEEKPVEPFGASTPNFEHVSDPMS
ncbi:CoA transferase [Dongshaea marina]|uniref:CoA transferase n=1 Tax=Dongshaea marina TaxID=2047966 RepID=UPI000D3E2296|nr:CoA transferase [Dongshaea marina]